MDVKSKQIFVTGCHFRDVTFVQHVAVLHYIAELNCAKDSLVIIVTQNGKTCCLFIIGASKN